MDRDAEIGCNLSETTADICFGAEVESAAVGEPGGERLCDKQTTGAVARSDRRRLIEQRARVENLADLGVWVSDGFAPGLAQSRQDQARRPEPGSWIRCSRR